VISIDKIPKDANKEERDKIFKRSQIIINTNNLIYLTNKALSNKYNKELKQYTKDNSKVYLIILGIVNNEIFTTLKHRQTVKNYINYLK
jgi:hypothetical protein